MVEHSKIPLPSDDGVFDPPTRQMSVSANPLRAFLVLGVLAAVLIGLIVASRGIHNRSSGLPVLKQIPAWEAQDQNGQVFRSSQLANKVFVVEFFFSSCTTVCPVLTQKVANLQSRLVKFGTSVHTLSVSVDAVGDTPERLTDYASRHRADLSRWTFVRAADDKATDKLCNDFAQGVDLPRRKDDGSFDPLDLAHVSRLGLVDRHGRLRGMYETDEAGLPKLVTDIERLVNEE